MKTLFDYQIIQRDPDGFARIPFEGNLPEGYEPQHVIICRVIFEDDNSIAIPYTKCEIADGKWKINLTVPEGGLYRFEVVRLWDENGDPDWSDRIACVFHVGVGDIYICAGQSNMTGYGKGPAYDPPCLGVHAFANDGNWKIATHPISGAFPNIFSPSENCTGTSPALSFARKLKAKLGVPIGLIPAAVGGTPLADWNPEENGQYYKATLKRLEYTGPVKGVVWFQGCSDCDENECKTYLARFTRMVELWRAELGNLPFLTVQLNRYCGGNHADWGKIRDDQRLAAINIPGVYLISSIDLPISDGIHNNSTANVAIGERLADTALAKIYGKAGYNCCPYVVKATYKDEKTVVITFSEPGVHGMEEYAHGFDIEDKDGILPLGHTEAHGYEVTVSASRPYTLPAKLHALWKTQPPALIPRGSTGLPVASCYGVEIEK